MLANMSMDSEQDTPLSISEVQCCSCECACSTLNRSNSGAWLRKFQESNVAMVELENECFMLREMVKNQQEMIDNLSVELEEERNASSSSANEAMSMILRLQREKAEVQMEFRQYKRFVEEKIVHDGEEILALEELLYKREQVIESLTCDMETYKQRMSFGLADVEAEGEKVVISQNNGNDYWEAEHDIPTYDYPCTECNSYENQLTYEVNNDAVEVEKHVFGEMLQCQGQFQDLEYPIKQLEESFTHSQPDVELFGTNNVLEKVIVSHSPRYRHVRRSSNDNSSSNYLSVKLETTDVASDLGSTEKKECVHVHLEENSNSKRVDTTSELGDGMSDRLHTVDSGQQEVPYNSVTEQKATVGIRQNYMTTQKEPLHMENFRDQDIKKLYMRLQVLEADRESMRQALISIGIEKARLVLLKEIAQQLCQNMSFAKTLPVRKTSVSRIFSIFKWILSFIFWRKKARQCRYIFGMSAHNIELLALLDKGARVRRWRSILSTKV